MCVMTTGSKTPTRFRGSAETRAMLRRMMRTPLALVPSTPAERTPAQVISSFFEECGIDLDAGSVAELSARLQADGVRFWDDDGRVLGTTICDTLTAICDALATQAGLIAEAQWPEKNKLRMRVDRWRREIHETLGELGLA